MKALFITLLLLFQLNSSEHDIRLQGIVRNGWDTEMTFTKDYVIYNYSSESGIGGSYTDKGSYGFVGDTLICKFKKTVDSGPYKLRLDKHRFTKTNRKDIHISFTSNINFNDQHRRMGGHYFMEDLQRKFNITKTNVYFLDKKNTLLDSAFLIFDWFPVYSNHDMNTRPHKILLDLGQGVSKTYLLPPEYNEYNFNSFLEEPIRFGKPAYTRKFITKRQDSILSIPSFQHDRFSEGTLKIIH